MKLVEIMAKLRSADGCPWDREQTHESLRPYLIEEAYEALDAIDEANDEHLREELGDVLLQVVFHAQIAHETGRFDFDEVEAAIVDKLIRRHPHVFGNEEATTSAQVLRNWEKIKQAEQGERRRSVLDGLPRQLPALLHAFRIQEKVAEVNFDWNDVRDVLAKVREEIDELEEAIDGKVRERMEQELGDLLFSVVNLSRHIGIAPEDALRKSNQRFSERFRYIEKALELKGERIEQASFERLDELWEEAKERTL